MKIGSLEHRDTFCRHFMQTYTEFDPDTLPWPDLDEEALKRLKSVPTPRARHLAEAITAYRGATEIAPGNPEMWLGLGSALHEARDRFRETEWPLDANAFDKEAKEHGADPAFWEDTALAVRAIRASSTSTQALPL